MVNTLLYFGNFDRNFGSLKPTTKTYVDKDGQINEVEKATTRVNGLEFWYMEKPGKVFVAVGVEGVALREPVLLDRERHTDGKGFCTGPHIMDESARHLLDDMITANPELSDDLQRLMQELVSK
jgi:hypothetical protein